MAKGYLIQGINPDTGATLYLDSNDQWVERIIESAAYTKQDALAAVIRVDRRNRQLDREDQIHPSIKGL